MASHQTSVLVLSLLQSSLQDLRTSVRRSIAFEGIAVTGRVLQDISILGLVLLLILAILPG